MKLDDCVSFQLARTARALYRPYTDRLHRYRLTAPQLFVLLALYDRDGLTAGELATHAQLDKSTLTGLLSRLENSGWVMRCSDEHDGRAVRVLLTDHARRYRRPLVSIYEEVNGRVLQTLGTQAPAWPAVLTALERAAVEAEA
jgi:DNA-binding MarR family transcriptional regulator